MVTIANAHTDIIHDTVLDYYGKRLATCSSDKTIKIFEIDGTESYKLVDTLAGHEGPVWSIDWAHPKFGNILASASYDGKVLVWKEEQGKWSQIAVHSVHSASVNSVKWGPHEYGALLLAGSSDGKVSIVEFKDNGTMSSPIVMDAHAIGVNSVSWAPAVLENIDSSSAKQLRRFVTGGADNLVKIWQYDEQSSTYTLQDTLQGHSDWVRDVAWSPSVLSRSYIASVSQDRNCIVWTQENNSGPWKKTLLTKELFPDVLWKASWSLSGNILAISGGDNKVTLWKENLEGDWESAGDVQQ